MNNPLVSVIIPIYNYEQYLEKCLESVINQTYRNLEIILVDDGSTDNSGVICDRYAAMDQRIAVRHKENGGIGSAYRVAFDICKGDYIAFVDADDYLELCAYEKQVEAALATDADIVESGEYMTGLDGVIRSKQILKEEIIVGNDAIIYDYLVNLTLTPLGMKFCKSSMYKDINIPEVSVGIDEIVSIHVILQAKKLVKISGAFYYVLGEPGKDSVSRRAIDGKRILDQINVHHDIMMRIEKQKSVFLPYYIVRYLRFLRGMFIYQCKDEKVKRKLVAEFRKYINRIKNQREIVVFGGKNIWSLKLFSFAPYTYGIMMRILRPKKRV